MSDNSTQKNSWLSYAGFAIFTVLWLTVIGPAIDSKVTQDTEQTVPTQETDDQPAISPEVAQVVVNPPVTNKEQTVNKLKPVFFGSAEDNTFRMLIDPQQGVLTTELGKFKKDLSENSDVYKIGHETLPSYNLSGDVVKAWKFGQAVITGEKAADSDIYTSLTITRPILGENLILVQSWKPSNGESASAYRFNYTITLRNTATEARSVKGLQLNIGQVGPVSIDQAAVMGGMDQAIDVYSVNDEDVDYERLSSIREDIEESVSGQIRWEDVPADGFHWVSVKNRYFASIVESLGTDLSKISEEGTGTDMAFTGTFISKTTEEVPGKEGELKQIDYLTANAQLPDFSIAAGSETNLHFDCFVGPQEYELLDSLLHDKQDVMQLSFFVFTKIGWLGYISERLLLLLVFLKSIIGSYGLAIIGLTVAIKACLWPLTAKANKSMKNMSALAPQMKELREKYQDDPQVLNQKVMQLYKENSVNPLGGCLPMFLQMPIFIALYNTLRGAIELRHEGFMWAQDLSQADTIMVAGFPINPLVLSWAAAMVIQQKIVPSSADPAQKKMMMLMPVVMLFVCYSMPSGLTLYWTVSTLMTILQYALNNRKSDSTIQGAESANK